MMKRTGKKYKIIKIKYKKFRKFEMKLISLIKM